MRFPYQQYQVSPSATVPSGMIHRPVVSVKINGAVGDIFLWAIADSGSDETLLPLSVGLKIGARLDHSQTWQTEGIGGQTLPVTAGEVEVELSDGQQTFQWQAMVEFVAFADPADEVTVLGHAGFLDFFRTTFDGNQHELEVVVAPSFPGKVR